MGQVETGTQTPDDGSRGMPEDEKDVREVVHIEKL
jgi:hypothetical protein